MARILKRPMFNRGGSPNQGIMEGLVDRTGFQNGTENPFKTRVGDRSQQILDIINDMAPVAKTKIPYGQVGADMFLGDTPLKEAVYKGYKQYKSDDAKRAAGLENRKAQAVGLAMSDIQKEMMLEKQLKAQAAKNDPDVALKNMFIKKSSDEGYDLPEARRIADYQLTIKTELQEKVGRNRVAGILDFDISNPAQLKKRLPKLKNQTGMYFFDPFDGKIKLLTNKNGILGFDDFNSIEEITFAAPDAGSATTKEISSNPSYMRETNPDVITPSIKKFLQNVEENQTPTFDIDDIG